MTQYEVVSPLYDRLREDGSYDTVLQDYVFVEAENEAQAIEVGAMKMQQMFPNGYLSTVDNASEEDLLVHGAVWMRDVPSQVDNPDATPPAPVENKPDDV